MELASRIGTRHGAHHSARPVLLTTLGVPFDPDASAFAVDSAVEAGQALVIANVVELPPLGMSVAMGYDQLPDAPEDEATLAAPAELARALGVRVERLRVRSPRPVGALVELAAELSPSILVFGPDRGRMRARAYRRAAKAVRERSTCLVWLPD